MAAGRGDQGGAGGRVTCMRAPVRDRMRPRGADPCQGPAPARRPSPAAMRRGGVRDGAARDPSPMSPPGCGLGVGRHPTSCDNEAYWGAYLRDSHQEPGSLTAGSVPDPAPHTYERGRGRRQGRGHTPKTTITQAAASIIMTAVRAASRARQPAPSSHQHHSGRAPRRRHPARDSPRPVRSPPQAGMWRP